MGEIRPGLVFHRARDERRAELGTSEAITLNHVHFQCLMTQQGHYGGQQFPEYFKVASREDFECTQHRDGKGL